jgi:hypothetical protein
MLPLNGLVTATHGFQPQEPRQVLRLRSPKERPEESADAALIRLPDDFDAAIAAGFSQALVIRDETGALPPGMGRVVQLSSKFDYLSDGDVLGFHPGSKRFRTLYRRASAHNSFLVTERCNHYCLMCSQPPRDVDDSWILREIREALPLVDKQTRSLGFTGGEPLLDWKE